MLSDPARICVGPSWLHVLVPHITLRAQPSVAASPRLDADQLAVVRHTGSPLLVLAGPGTGKTTTIVEAVIARLTGDQPLLPSQVLVLTFSRLAAAELRSRIVARSPAAVSPVVATFHSFAWALLREFAPGDPLDGELQLLAAPDAELAVRELLADPADSWRRHWPADRQDALTSPALVDELIALMSSARAQGWEPEELAQATAAGLEHPGGPVPAEWRAAAEFFEHYLQILDWRGAVDYSEVIHRARLLLAERPELSGRFRAIYVDEYQDTDPAQVGLIRALAAPGTTVVAVGDPDQAIYRFRGADVQGILDFPRQFAAADGTPADVAVLRHTRRFGPAIRAVADRWIAPVGLGSLPARVQREHRSPICASDHGSVDVIVSATPEQQAATVADVLRRAHLAEDAPLAWSDMAVLVRSGVADIPRLERALLAAGVPVEVPAGDRPLAHEPALAPLLTGLQLAADPQRVDLESIEGFLCSPLVGMTSWSLRRLLRGLRVAERAAAEREGGRQPRPARELLAECCVAGASLPPEVSGRDAVAFDQVLDTLDRMRAPGLGVGEQLWLLWAHGGTAGGEGRWAQQLRNSSLTGGPGAHRADAVLDSVMELFNVADRMPKGAGSSVFLDTLTHHRIPAARIEAGPQVRDSVSLLTVHRAKGAQWPLVMVLGLQQDQWPDARGPVTLLTPERIGSDGVRAQRTRAELAADERRLAFVAATRASQRLVIMAVDSAGSDESPSVLFAEAAAAVGRPPTESGAAARRARLTPTALVASLRTVLNDEQRPVALRRAAAHRLARLAATDHPTSALANTADPDRWWGVHSPTQSTAPLTAPGQPVRLSATAVSGVNECPLRWFLSRRLHAGTPRPTPAAYGSVLHAAIAAVVAGELPADAEAIAEAIREPLASLPYAARWEQQLQWAKAQEDIARFVDWYARLAGTPLAAEVPFDVVVGTPSVGSGAAATAAAGDDPAAEIKVRLTGSIDLLVADPHGGVRVVDFKTGANVPSKADTEENTQLGVYQLAVAEGAAAAAPDGEETDVGGADEALPAGGSLVFLAKGIGAGGLQASERHQQPLTERDWLDEQVGGAAATVIAEQVVARVSSACSRCDFQSMCPAWSQLDWTDAT